MKYRDNYLYIVVPVFQIVAYLAGYEFTNRLAHRMGLVHSKGVDWGITASVHFSYYITIIILLSVSVFIMPRKILLLSIMASIIFVLLIYPVLDAYPYRGAATILIGIVGIFTNCLLFVRCKADNG